MDSDYPVTRRYAMTRAAVSLAKRATKRLKSVTGQYGAVVGDVGIEPTAAACQGSAIVTGKIISLTRYQALCGGPIGGGPPPHRAGSGPPFSPLSRSDCGPELPGSCPRICPRDVQIHPSSGLGLLITRMGMILPLCRHYVGLRPGDCDA